MNRVSVTACLAFVIGLMACETYGQSQPMADVDYHFLTWSGYSGFGEPEKANYILDGQPIGNGTKGFQLVVDNVIGPDAKMHRRKRLYIFPHYSAVQEPSGLPTGTEPYTRYRDLLRRLEANNVDIVLCPGDCTGPFGWSTIPWPQKDVQHDILVNSLGMPLRLVSIGSRESSSVGDGNQENYYIGINEVTQSEFATVMRSNPSRHIDLLCPVESVTPKEAMEFCKLLSEFEQERRQSRLYGLPSAVEWERACRSASAESHSRKYTQEPSMIVRAWCRDNANARSHSVRTLVPNSWGIYDMYGNVNEMCLVRDGSGETIELRGGSFRSPASECLEFARALENEGKSGDDIGFRVVMKIRATSP